MITDVDEAWNILDQGDKKPFAQLFVDKISKNQPSVGLDFVLEIQKEDAVSVAGCKYWCAICKKSMLGYTLLPHITGDIHTLNFLEKSFPSVNTYMRKKKKEDPDYLNSTEFNDYLAKITAETGTKTLSVVQKKDEEETLKKFTIILQNMSRLKYYNSITVEEVVEENIITEKEEKESDAPIAEKMTKFLNLKQAPPKPRKTPVKPKAKAKKPPPSPPREQPKEEVNNGRTPSPEFVAEVLDEERFPDDHVSPYNEILAQFGEIDVKELALLDYEYDPLPLPDPTKKDPMIIKREESNNVDMLDIDGAKDFKEGTNVILQDGEVCEALDLMVLPNNMFLVKVETSAGNIYWTEQPQFQKYVPPRANDFRHLSNSCWGDVSDRIKNLNKMDSFAVKYAASSATARRFIPNKCLDSYVSVYPWRVYKDGNGIAFIRGFRRDDPEKHCSFECKLYDWRSEDDGSLSVWKMEYPDFVNKEYTIQQLAEYMSSSNLTDTMFLTKKSPIMIKIFENVEKLLQNQSKENTESDALRRLTAANLLAPIYDEWNLPHLNDLLISNEEIHFRSDIYGDLGDMNQEKLQSSMLLRNIPTQEQIRDDFMYRTLLRSAVACYSLLQKMIASFSKKESLFPELSTADEDSARVAFRATLTLICKFQKDRISSNLSKLLENRKAVVESCVNKKLPETMKSAMYKCPVTSNTLCRDVWESVKFEARMLGEECKPYYYKPNYSKPNYSNFNGNERRNIRPPYHGNISRTFTPANKNI